MSEIKKCKTCEIEKELNKDNFIPRKTSTGIRWEGTCRKCNNEKRAKERTEKLGIEYNPKQNKPAKTQNLSLEKEIYNMFDETEIEVLKNLIKDYPALQDIKVNKFDNVEIEILKNIISKNNDLMTMLNHRINFEKIEDSKIKKSITISKLNHKKILELSKDNNLNYSQIVDSLIQKALENI